MTARRWPVITIGLIVINVVVFLFTIGSIDEQAPALGQAKAHILILAALHPELKLQPEAQNLVDSFKQSHPAQWTLLQNPNRDIFDAYDANVRLMDDPEQLQKEMDAQSAEYVKVSSASLAEKYAFVPAKPNPISYLTANFLHGWRDLCSRMPGDAGCTALFISSRARPRCNFMPGRIQAASRRRWVRPAQ